MFGVNRCLEIIGITTILQHKFNLCYNGTNAKNGGELRYMLLINGKAYYKVNETAELAGVNTRTLRRWIASGNLDHFLFPYRRTRNGPMYFRLEPPDESDVLWENEQVYHMPKPQEGGGVNGRQRKQR